MSSVQLERVGRVATAVTVLVSIAAALAVLGVVASQAAQGDAQAFLAGTIDDETFLEQAAPYLLMTTVQAVITLATAVVTIIWMFRLAKNHRTLHRGGTWGPGWAIGGWLLPPLFYVIPTLTLREIWKASDPDVAIGGDWRSGRASPLIWLWFVLYSLGPIAIIIAQNSGGISLGASERDMAEQIIDNEVTTVVGAALSVAAAATFIVIVRQLTARHRQLTGEAATG